MTAIEWSDPSDEVRAAFYTALANIGAVSKSKRADMEKSDGTVSYSYTYATLADTLAEVKRVCRLNDLVLTQPAGMVTNEHGDYLTVDVTVVHKSGEWATFGPMMCKVGADPQKAGGALTFLRRYTLTTVFAIPTDDDDAHGATEAVQGEQPATPQQLRNIGIECSKKGIGKDERLDLVRALLGDEEIQSSKSLTKSQAAELLVQLDAIPNETEEP